MIGNRQRIMIIGQSGSGKSTLARQIGERLDLPVVHIDQLIWKPGWTEVAVADKDAACSAVHARERWIFEGGHSTTWPERLDRAQVLIWLDVPFATRSWRVIWRTTRYYGTTRPDLTENCPEHFDREFLKWVWDTRNTDRLKMQRFFDAAPSDKVTLRLCTRDDVKKFVSAI